MKQWMSAVLLVLVSTPVLGAAEFKVGGHEAAAKAEVAKATPVQQQAPATQVEPAHIRYSKFVNQCVLEQGVVGNPKLNNLTRAAENLQ